MDSKSTEVKTKTSRHCWIFGGIVLLTLVAGGLGIYFGLFHNKKNDQANYNGPRTIPIDLSLGKLEPPNGLSYVGFHIDWNKEKPSDIIRKLNNRTPAILYIFNLYG
jgi:hypothetical protein